MRQAKLLRETRETKIDCELNLDAPEKSTINTGVGMFDHMLDLLSFHGAFQLNLTASGDLEVDSHHLIEDVAITLGGAIDQALQDKSGIARYATCFLPMDESLVRTVLDISGRGVHVFCGDFKLPAIGAFPSDMVEHFFYSLAINAKMTLHQKILYGANDHHKLEALFKGLGKALRQAWLVTGSKTNSTKGML